MVEKNHSIFRFHAVFSSDSSVIYIVIVKNTLPGNSVHIHADSLHMEAMRRAGRQKRRRKDYFYLQTAWL